MANLKPNPNEERYFDGLRAMTPEQRIDKVFEITEFTRDLLRNALRRKHPQASEAELHRLYLEHLRECHNSSY